MEGDTEVYCRRIRFHVDYEFHKFMVSVNSKLHSDGCKDGVLALLMEKTTMESDYDTKDSVSPPTDQPKTLNHER